jgi:hypothetical protein
LQGMILAFDQETLQTLLLPHLRCFEDMRAAVFDGETMITQRNMAAGFNAVAMESRFAAHAGHSQNATKFLEWCVDSPGNEHQGQHKSRMSRLV